MNVTQKLLIYTGWKKEVCFDQFSQENLFFFHWQKKLAVEDYCWFYSALLKRSMALGDDAFACLYKVYRDFWLSLDPQIRCSCSSKHRENIAS